MQLLHDHNEQTCVGGSIHSCSGRRETAKAGKCVMAVVIILDITIIVNMYIDSI